ncbi:hypothetical protein E4T48_04186 [Aureobasidium sp. EXF-10727]|nr:hypothetical protein E4T48_04186 [Aureobasidium sp. EXF-10727]
MHLMYTLDSQGKRVYTLKKVNGAEVTKSAHPARFSPDDKYSRQKDEDNACNPYGEHESGYIGYAHDTRQAGREGHYGQDKDAGTVPSKTRPAHGYSRNMLTLFKQTPRHSQEALRPPHHSAEYVLRAPLSSLEAHN